MFRCLLVLIGLFVSTFEISFATEKPKLVLIVSLDQFRYDYLTRFSPYFGERGFNLFLRQGANFVNAEFAHSITITGPGHAVIMSGTYANVNGIIANNWYDLQLNKNIYCVEDENSPLIRAHDAGRSPKNFIGTTVGDQLKLSNAGQSKVISLALKDRAAILMGGKLADAAYWLIDSLFVTSSYYMDDLPAWVKRFNAAGKINAYFGKVWKQSLPESAYHIQGPDDVTEEDDNYGMGRTFPHIIDGGNKSISKSYFTAFKRSPFASEVLADFAMSAIVEEQLGQRGVPDILCVGFSANDFVGHAYGPNSHEVMDITICSDRILEKLFHFVDQKVGLQNCTILLTGDHGVAPMPEALSSQNKHVDAIRVNASTFRNAAETALNKKFGSLHNSFTWIVSQKSDNIYFNLAALKAKNIALSEAEQVVKDTLQCLPTIAQVYTHTQLEMVNVA
ncbi:MAG: alkaline phosphatase family protein, partial [bacterium]